MRPALLALLLVGGCSSSSSRTPDGAAVPAFECPQTIAQLRAQPPAGDHPDYNLSFAAASGGCDPLYNETFESCDGPYDRMTWSEFPNCGGILFYDHASGELVAVFTESHMTGDLCSADSCSAGPAQFFAPGSNCTIVARCGN